MMKIIKLVSILGLGLGSGVISALWMSGLIGGKALDSFADINAGGWRSDWSIGSPAADPYLRARVARHGLLALSKKEAVYFTRNVDDEGEPLRQDCQYELSGGGQDAMWWSITLYDGDSRLPMNTDNALSIDATKVGGAETWRAMIAPVKPQDAPYWLSSNHAGQFDLMIRLYRPSKAVLDDPETNINPPRIQRLGCQQGSGA